MNARFAEEEAAGTAPAATPPEGFRLLHGCELEIRADGKLDFEDDLLSQADRTKASPIVSPNVTRRPAMPIAPRRPRAARERRN